MHKHLLADPLERDGIHEVLQKRVPVDIIENSHLRGIVVAITMKYHIPIVGTGCLANVLGSDLLESLVF